jgi:hypothetical protein
MSTFTDPLEPESFEHNGQHPEVDDDEEERDSFDEKAEDDFKEFVGDAEPTEGPAPAG